jgi:hypothetical protein
VALNFKNHSQNILGTRRRQAVGGSNFLDKKKEGREGGRGLCLVSESEIIGSTFINDCFFFSFSFFQATMETF